LQPLFQPAQHFFEKREGSGSVFVTKGYGLRMRIRDAQKHTYPMDPDADPEHYVLFIKFEANHCKENNLFT
jgi:hypothetical protein